MDSSIPILLPVSSVYAHTLALSMLTRFLEPAELPIPLPLPRRFSLPHHTPPPATHTHIYGKGHSVAYLQQFNNVFGHLGPYFQHTIWPTQSSRGAGKHLFSSRLWQQWKNCPAQTHIDKRNYSLIIEYFVVKSSGTSSIIKTRLQKVLVCVFGRGSGCFVILFISKVLGGKLDQILFLHFLNRESGGTSSKGECFPFVFSD